MTSRVAIFCYAACFRLYACMIDYDGDGCIFVRFLAYGYIKRNPPAVRADGLKEVCGSGGLFGCGLLGGSFLSVCCCLGLGCCGSKLGLLLRYGFSLSFVLGLLGFEASLGV